MSTETKSKVRHAVTMSGSGIEYKGSRYEISEDAIGQFVAYALRALAKKNLSIAEIAKDDDENVNRVLTETVNSVNSGSYLLRDNSGTQNRFATVLAAISNRSLEDANTIIASKRSTLGPENFVKWESKMRHLDEFKAKFKELFPRKPKTGGGRKKSITLDSLLS